VGRAVGREVRHVEQFALKGRSVQQNVALRCPRVAPRLELASCKALARLAKSPQSTQKRCSQPLSRIAHCSSSGLASVEHLLRAHEQ